DGARQPAGRRAWSCGLPVTVGRGGKLGGVRIAILADVHGNLPALEAVLADIASQGVDRLVVNGDSVNRGPESVPVMRALAKIDHDSVMGNHDDVMLMIVERRDVD